MRSMTGFGQAQVSLGGTHCTIEIKTVNHRHFDARFRTPAWLSSLEPQLVEKLKTGITRGSADVSIRALSSTQGSKNRNSGPSAIGTRFTLDEVALSSILEIGKVLKARYKIDPTLRLGELASVGRVLVPLEETADPSAVRPVVDAFDKALEELLRSRDREGTKIADDLCRGIRELRDLVRQMRSHTASHSKGIEAKLREKITQWQQGGALSSAVDPRRLEWEIAFYADRSDIHEELERLAGHCDAFEETVRSPAAVGRRLDFLTQELNREANTVASKSASLELTQIVILSKASIEKLREQIQNVE